MSKTNKILTYVFVALSLVGAIFLYYATGLKGFPDGYLTELERAEKPMFYVLCFILIAYGFFTIYLVWFSKWKNSKKLFYQTTLFLLAIIVLVVSVDQHVVEILHHSGEG